MQVQCSLCNLHAHTAGSAADVTEILKLRKLAQEAAEGAAPYIHPRLSSVEMKAEIEDKRVVERKPLSAEEWAKRHDAELPNRPH